MSTTKQTVKNRAGLFGFILCGILVGLIAGCEASKQFNRAELPIQYPAVDQTSMTLTLRPGERFISVQHNGSYLTFVTTTDITPVNVRPRSYQVYSGQMDGMGTMLQQPRTYYTIKEQ